MGTIKSVMVLAGSVVEAVLLEYFLQFMPAGYTIERVYKLTFQSLLDLAETEGLLNVRNKNLAWVIKDYRNLIHSGKEVRKSETFSFEDAKISDALVSIIVNAIQEKYSASFGYTAADVITKLENDWNSRTIYKKLILKLRDSEKAELLRLLVANEIREKKLWEDCFLIDGSVLAKKITELEFSKPFIAELKPLVHNDLILHYLGQLLKEIEMGEQSVAFSLYNLFHEDIGYLNTDEIETITVYMLAMVMNVHYKSRDLVQEKTYTTIGKYIVSDRCREALGNLAVDCTVNFDARDIAPSMGMFEQLFNSLIPTDRVIMQDAISKYYSHFTLPINDAFYRVAVNKGIIIEI